MSSEQPGTPPTQDDAPAPAEGRRGSGEGAGTALQALIRKRRLAEQPDPPEPAPPATPLP